MAIRPYNPPLEELKAAVERLLTGDEEVSAIQKLLLKVGKGESVQRDLGSKLLESSVPEHSQLGAQMVSSFAQDIWRRYYVGEEPPADMVFDEGIVLRILAASLSDDSRIHLLQKLQSARFDVSAAEEYIHQVSASKPEKRIAASCLMLIGGILASRGDLKGLGSLGLSSKELGAILGGTKELRLSDALAQLLRTNGLTALHCRLLLEEGEPEQMCDVILQSEGEVGSCAKLVAEAGATSVVEQIMARRAESPASASRFLIGASRQAALRETVRTDVLRELALEPDCLPHVLKTLPYLCGLRKEELGLPPSLVKEALSIAEPAEAATLLSSVQRAGKELAQDVWPIAAKLLSAKVASARASAAWFISNYPSLVDDKLLKKLFTRAGESDYGVREASAHALIALASAGRSIDGAEAKLTSAVKKRRRRNDELKLSSSSASGIALGLILHERGESNAKATRATWFDALHSSSELLAAMAKERIDAEIAIEPDFAKELESTLKP